MLILARKPTQAVKIGGGLTITVRQIDREANRSVVRLVFEGTPGVDLGSGSTATPTERGHQLRVWDVTAQRDDVVQGTLEAGATRFCITICQIRGQTVRLGIEVADDVPIWRIEPVRRDAERIDGP